MPVKRILLLALMLAAGAVSAQPSAPAPSRPRPNILFIGVDDLRPELGAYGASEVRSPFIDALARRAIRFDRAYVQQAVCGPSRASLLTGLRPDATGVTDNAARFRERVPDVVTLPQHFQAHGYHTVNFGKIFHGLWNDPASWSEPAWDAPQLRTNNIRGYLSWRNLRLLGERNYPTQAAVNPGHASFWEDENVPDNAYLDGITVEKAIDALPRLKGRPFFLAVGIERPHLPWACPRRYWSLYDRRRIALPRNYRPPVGATPFTGSWEDFRHYPDSPTPETITDDQARLAIHGYRACVSYADALIGKLLEALDRNGLRQSTIVVLWGDHGYKLGEHFMWSKGTNYEFDARAPLLIAKPGLTDGGLSTSGIVEFVDIYPTLASLAGLPRPSHLQGVDLSPLLTRPTLTLKRVAWSQYPRRNGEVMGYSMRTDRYRYTRWHERRTGLVLARELYDHAVDPAENVNLANGRTAAALLAQMDRRFEAEYRHAHGHRFRAGRSNDYTATLTRSASVISAPASRSAATISAVTAGGSQPLRPRPVCAGSSRAIANV